MLNQLVDSKVNQIQIGFERRVKQMKPFIFNEAATFIKEQARVVTQLMTR